MKKQILSSHEFSKRTQFFKIDDSLKVSGGNSVSLSTFEDAPQLPRVQGRSCHVSLFCLNLFRSRLIIIISCNNYFFTTKLKLNAANYYPT